MTVSPKPTQRRIPFAVPMPDVRRRSTAGIGRPAGPAASPIPVPPTHTAAQTRHRAPVRLDFGISSIWRSRRANAPTSTRCGSPSSTPRAGSRASSRHFSPSRLPPAVGASRSPPAYRRSIAIRLSFAPSMPGSSIRPMARCCGVASHGSPTCMPRPRHGSLRVAAFAFPNAFWLPLKSRDGRMLAALACPQVAELASSAYGTDDAAGRSLRSCLGSVGRKRRQLHRSREGLRLEVPDRMGRRDRVHGRRVDPGADVGLGPLRDRCSRADARDVPDRGRDRRYSGSTGRLGGERFADHQICRHQAAQRCGGGEPNAGRCAGTLLQGRAVGPGDAEGNAGSCDRQGRARRRRRRARVCRRIC